MLPNSPKKVWWKCKFGHSWQASIYSRNKGSGCPYCSHERLDETYSLAVVNPDLARRFHPKKNGNLSPEDIFPHSNKKYWWICEKGHEFEASVTNLGRQFSCPECTKELKTSFPEQSIFYYIVQKYNDAINRFVENGYEIDIYIPSLKIGIEYDGIIYHTSDTKTKEDRKDAYYAEQGITIIRVKETKESLKDTDLIVWHRINSSYTNLNDSIRRLFVKLSIYDFDIDISRDAAKISASYLSLERENSISNKSPLLLKEWDFEKNGYLNPQYVLEKSTKPIWWICEKGHSYMTSPARRTIRNQGCPYCSGRYPTEDDNLLVRFPTICEEWNYDKNGDSLPHDYTPSSGKKVWWICSVCGYEYLMPIASRTSNGQGCPNCAKSKRLDSFNSTIIEKNGSFGQKHQDLLKEWDYSKNNISPFEIPECSEIKVWWICNVCGNEWESAVRNRSKSHGCPICSEKRKAMKRCKSVLMYTKDGVFIKKFDSLTEAGKELGKDISSISFCCNGKTKTAYGYVWKYEGGSH